METPVGNNQTGLTHVEDLDFIDRLPLILVR